MWEGADASERDVSAARSESVNAAGAKRLPSQSAAMASAFIPRSSLSMPKTRARAVSWSMIQALEARRRSTSQISPEIAARSPEPAKRCAVPHSFSTFAAGIRWMSMVSSTSMAAESRAAGVMENFRLENERNPASDQQQNLQGEVDPHGEQHQDAREPCQ
jgi:hypothetical protein